MTTFVGRVTLRVDSAAGCCAARLDRLGDRHRGVGLPVLSSALLGSLVRQPACGGSPSLPTDRSSRQRARVHGLLCPSTPPATPSSAAVGRMLEGGAGVAPSACGPPASPLPLTSERRRREAPPAERFLTCPPRAPAAGATARAGAERGRGSTRRRSARPPPAAPHRPRRRAARRRSLWFCPMRR